ncbi:MAG TPA: hypothetical protein VF157_15715 [Chloroflexota bacterium]
MLATSPGAMARSLLAALVLLVLAVLAILTVQPSGRDLVFAALWIVAGGVALAGLLAAAKRGRLLVGVGAVLAAAGALLAFYWQPMPGSLVWPVLFLGGVLLVAYASRADSWHQGAWPLVIARVAIGWGWLDNAQDHLRGAAQSVWVPGGGGYLTVAKGATLRGAPPGTQGAQPYVWFGDPAYVSFLRDAVTANGDLWAGLTLCGEMTFGILLAVGLVTPVAAVGSMWQSANYGLMKGFFVHGAYTDKVFFLLAALCFVTAAGLSYGLDASLRSVVPGWLAEILMGQPKHAGEQARAAQPRLAPT